MNPTPTHLLRVRFDLQARIDAIDEDLAAALGHRASDLVGGPLAQLMSAGGPSELGARLLTLVDRGRPTHTGRFALARKNGSSVPALITITRAADPQGHLSGFEALVLLNPESRAVTERLERTVLAANEALFRSMTETSPVGMARLAPDGTIAYLNAAFASAAGDGAEIAAQLTSLVHPQDRARVSGALAGIDGAGASGAVQCRFGADDEGRWLTLRFASVVDELVGHTATTVTIEPPAGTVDESEPSRSELAYLATHDPLTGLPNRGLLLDHMQLALARSARDSQPIAVMFVDLDKFKAVNDTHGHEAGDELLRVIAQKMSGVLRPSDTVARLGGDEFVVLCEDIEGEVDAMVIADRIRAALEPGTLLVAGEPSDVTVSIGVAISSGPTDSPESLIEQADTAMYRAKRSGPGRIELFDEVLRERNRRREQLRRELAQALEAETLTVHYQPIVDLQNGRIRGAEALVRWSRGDLGSVSPRSIVDLAVGSGLDRALDAFVLRRACADAAKWQSAHGSRAPRLHVNVTRRSVTSGRIVADVERNMALTGLAPGMLCVELSEGLVMGDVDASTDRLARLHEMGVTIAIDDVGSGTTSLQRLRHVHLDLLKVDASLTRNMLDDPVSQQLVGAAIAVGRALDLTIAVEAVEHAEAIPVLRNMGAHLAQGNVLGPAMPASRLETLLGKRSRLVRP